MNAKNKKALLEGAKQIGRVVVVAVLPVLITSLSQGSIDWKSTIVACVVAGLMGIDKTIHKSDSERTGLVPF